MNPIISLRGIVKVFQDEEPVNALNQVDLDIFPGELLLIKGESGAGKTTLLSIMGLLQEPDKGEVKLLNGNLNIKKELDRDNYRRNYIGYAFQNNQLIEALTVDENLKFIQNLTGSKIEIESLIETFGLTFQKNRLPGTLSGGQKRRAMIMMSIAKDPNLILLDEPTNDLDEKWVVEILTQLKKISKSGKAVVIVSHEPKCESYADRILEMNYGKLLKPSVDK